MTYIFVYRCSAGWNSKTKMWARSAAARKGLDPEGLDREGFRFTWEGFLLASKSGSKFLLARM